MWREPSAAARSSPAEAAATGSARPAVAIASERITVKLIGIRESLEDLRPFEEVVRALIVE